jgi:hypothetical protein
MMDIVERHSDIETSGLSCETAPSGTRKETQFLDEDECTRRLPSRHQGCMGEPHLDQSNQFDLPTARAHSQVIGIRPSLAHELRSGKRATEILCMVGCEKTTHSPVSRSIDLDLPRCRTAVCFFPKANRRKALKMAAAAGRALSAGGEAMSKCGRCFARWIGGGSYRCPGRWESFRGATEFVLEPGE